MPVGLDIPTKYSNFSYGYSQFSYNISLSVVKKKIIKSSY